MAAMAIVIMLGFFGIGLIRVGERESRRNVPHFHAAWKERERERETDRERERESSLLACLGAQEVAESSPGSGFTTPELLNVASLQRLRSAPRLPAERRLEQADQHLAPLCSCDTLEEMQSDAVAVSRLWALPAQTKTKKSALDSGTRCLRLLPPELLTCVVLHQVTYHFRPT